MSDYLPLSQSPFDFCISTDGVGAGAGTNDRLSVLMRSDSIALSSTLTPLLASAPVPASASTLVSIDNLIPATAAPAPAPAAPAGPATTQSTVVLATLKQTAFERLIRKEKPRVVDEKELALKIRMHVVCRICENVLRHSRTKEKTWSCGHSIHLSCINVKGVKAGHCPFCDQKAIETTFEDATKTLFGSVVLGPCVPQKGDRIDPRITCSEMLPVGDKQAWVIHREVCVYGCRPCMKCHQIFNVRAMRQHHDQCTVCPLGCGAHGSRESMSKHVFECPFFEYQPPSSASQSGSPPEIAGAGAGSGSGSGSAVSSESRKRKTPSPPMLAAAPASGAGAGAGGSDAPALKRFKYTEPPVPSVIPKPKPSPKKPSIHAESKPKPKLQTCAEPGCHWKGKSVAKHAAKKHIKPSTTTAVTDSSSSSDSDEDSKDDEDYSDDSD